ncbi:hypothetical protein BH10BAC3_BH10BAC3_10880 [soil metagenome]
MKFINYLQGITGISIYPLFSLVLFFVFFVCATWFVLKTPKKQIEDTANIPLEH